MSKRDIRTLLAGEPLDLTTGDDAGKDISVTRVFCDGDSCVFSARTKGNEEGEQRDRSTTGIFVPGDSAKAISGRGVVFGPFDKVFCAAGSDPIRCLVEVGV